MLCSCTLKRKKEYYWQGMGHIHHHHDQLCKLLQIDIASLLCLQQVAKTLAFDWSLQISKNGVHRWSPSPPPFHFCLLLLTSLFFFRALLLLLLLFCTRRWQADCKTQESEACEYDLPNGSSRQSSKQKQRHLFHANCPPGMPACRDLLLHTTRMHVCDISTYREKKKEARPNNIENPLMACCSHRN